MAVEYNMLPHREANTAVVNTTKVPCNRKALFLAVASDILYDKTNDELAFGALSPNDRATFQFLLYLTYCCKGELLQVTLENTDFSSMSPPIREDFAHGRLFCFVLDMGKGSLCAKQSTQSSPGRAATDDDMADHVSSTQLIGLMDTIDMDVFNRDEPEDDTCSQAAEELLEEAFNAFMRLQLVRKKASSLNNAMLSMRDEKGELGSMFEWVDICGDTLNATQVDKKKVKELQGSMYTPACGRQTVLLPEPITGLNLKSMENSIGRITDSASKGEGKTLFMSIVSKLTSTQWLKQTVMQTGYRADKPRDMSFMQRLTSFTSELEGSSGRDEVDIRGLLVFRYALEKLIDRENPDLFIKAMLHRHVSVSQTRIDAVLCDIKRKRRTKALARLLNRGWCYCKGSGHTEERGPCGGGCQTAYSCFYNSSSLHPFLASKTDHSYYFARLYPHLGTLERLSKELKVKHRGCWLFESIANMVFNVLVNQRFSVNESLYRGLGEVIDENASNASLSLGHGLGLAKLRKSLYLKPVKIGDFSGEPSALAPLKVYDHALVRYLFCDKLRVGRLFQASTTFNYIIVNTAPRYTTQRIMLFNVTGPGEGKTYANDVLNLQFRMVKGCIETLTSFTQQAFKYKKMTTAGVVIIDDAHITHEKNVKAIDRESNVIPNTFKNLLDTSVLESDVVTRDVVTGRVETVKHESVHNCGFVWNTNTMGFVSEAWADRSLILESEFPERVTGTRSTQQLVDTVEKRQMPRIAAVCLFRQNLIQSATMIAMPELMQFGARFDRARDVCVAALPRATLCAPGP